MEPFTKIVRPGDRTFCKIEFDGLRLSISGVEGPKRNGDASGGCGQIVMSEWAFKAFAPGWDADLVSRFRAAWKDWHLNDMRAGSPAQSAFVKAHPDLCWDFDATLSALRAEGLQPDPNYLRHDKPYSYGSAWLRENVPEEVLDFLRSLPASDITPEWV